MHFILNHFITCVTHPRGVSQENILNANYIIKFYLYDRDPHCLMSFEESLKLLPKGKFNNTSPVSDNFSHNPQLLIQGE